MQKTGKRAEEHYIERDVSWMYFNQRILLEAEKESVPLLERLSFLGIYSNNLDEFFRVRVATLNRIIEYEDKKIKCERERAIATFKEINRLNGQYSEAFEETFAQVKRELEAADIWIVDETELNAEQQAFITQLYHYRLSGATTPLFFSGFGQLHDQPDEEIYLAVQLKEGKPARKRAQQYALIDLPVKEFGRFVRLPDAEGRTCLIFLDDVVRFCLPYIFAGTPYTDFEAYTFKFTKDAEMELDTDLRNGVMQKISKGVKSRKKGEPIRLVYDADMPAGMIRHISRMLHIDRWDTQVAGGRYHNMKDLMKFPKLRKELSYEPWPTKRYSLPENETLIDYVRKKDLLIHVPYESFDTFVRFLQECALSPEVLQIKATIYRAAKESQVVSALTSASVNGKKVTAVVELMARFDESSNISISQKLMESGCNVLTGEEGIKIHGKIVSVLFKDGTSLAVISTGNFHEGNARSYTDCLLFTADRRINKDVLSLFDFIEQPFRRVNFSSLLVSPDRMRNVFKKLIRNEEKNALSGLPARIKIKINHITDKEMVRLLYEAANAGVKIDLLVRGNCSLVTDLPFLKGNIKIKGIIDRYLEHSRIFIFHNNGKPLYFMGSADWMPRNLSNRIEVVTPVYDRDIQKQLDRIVDFGLQDNVKAVQVDGSGRYLPAPKNGKRPFRSQEMLQKFYQERQK